MYIYVHIYMCVYMGFSGGGRGKEPAANAGNTIDNGFNPWLER